MQFKVVPILAEMKEMYSKPISPNRFSEYISKLQGDTKGDLALPISGFNPMAKSHILDKINELEEIGAENIMEQTTQLFNQSISHLIGKDFEVYLNLADDLKGGWTNYYTTDFDSKFKINALVSRNFCTPYFWASENFTEDIIRNRTMAYLCRTFFWVNRPGLKCLEDYVEQEVFIANHLPHFSGSETKLSFENIQQHYLIHKESEDEALIFNFFYGDDACASLGYKTFGISGIKGFEFAKLLSDRRKKEISRKIQEG